MTAAQQREQRTPPRFLVRTFWALHRAAYRLSGGRVGLKQPEAGARFGFMRLSTVGRRSGKARRRHRRLLRGRPEPRHPGHERLG